MNCRKMEIGGDLYMIDQDKAISVISNFLNDAEKRILLVKGYDDDAKVKVVLGSLEKVFQKGIIRTNRMSDVSRHINRAFERDLLPNSVKSTTNYKLGKMHLNISSYVTHSKNNPRGSEDTFTVYYPVQTVLDNPKRYNEFLVELKGSKSKKIILITSTEWGIKNFDVEKHVDEVFFYSVENDNPQIMKNLRRNGAI